MRTYEREGVIVHKRVVIWQALEPGLAKIDRLSVETKGQQAAVSLK